MRKPLSFAVSPRSSSRSRSSRARWPGRRHRRPTRPTVALVSDIGKFNDRGFNQNQLAGLNKAKTNLGITALAKQSNSVSDYIPNMTSAVRQKADLVIAAGFLLADATATMAKKFPDTQVRDHRLPGRGGAVRRQEGQAALHERRGPDLRGQRGRLPRRRARRAQDGGGWARRRSAPSAASRSRRSTSGSRATSSARSWPCRARRCSSATRRTSSRTDKCKTVAENQIAQGAQVLFQVAGGCGLGTLKAADEAGKWGIGVDVDQYKLGKRVLTSAIKRVDNGVYQAIQQVKAGQVRRRLRPGVQPEERRHRPRQDEPGRHRCRQGCDERLTRRRSSAAQLKLKSSL